MPLEVAFHKFSTLSLITFDPFARFRTIFFQTMCDHKPHLPETFLSMQIVAVVRSREENSNLGKVGSEKWVGGETFCKIFKNFVEIFHIYQKTHLMPEQAI